MAEASLEVSSITTRNNKLLSFSSMAVLETNLPSSLIVFSIKYGIFEQSKKTDFYKFYSSAKKVHLWHYQVFKIN